MIVEEIATKTIKIEKNIHNFYCDDCGKHLGASEEYDDGYCEPLGQIELAYHTPRGWYSLNKHLCDNCEERFWERFFAALDNLGFKPE